MSFMTKHMTLISTKNSNLSKRMLASLAITGVKIGTWSEKIYYELELESLKPRRWFRKIWPFSKIQTKSSPLYLFDFIPNSNRVHNTRIAITSVVYANHDYFKNSFFLLLYLNGARLIWVLETHTTYIINFIRPSANNIFDIYKQ